MQERAQEPGWTRRDFPRKTRNCPALAIGNKSGRVFCEVSLPQIVGKGIYIYFIYFTAYQTSQLIVDVNHDY